MKTNTDTLFIIGNGPSLKGVDLKALPPSHTLGMNAAYRYWRTIDWRPTYYACLDEVVGLSHQEEIAALIKEQRIEKFLLRSNLIQALGEAALDKRVINFEALYHAKIGFDAAPTITTGSHATLWGALLGYKTIVLLGIDGRYKERVEGAESRGGIVLELTRESHNPNYFFDGYQVPGDRYCVPNPRPDLHIGAWRDAARNLDHFECNVYNANPNSAVRSFPFIDAQTLINNSKINLQPEQSVEPVSVREPSPDEQALDRNSRAKLFLRSQGKWCLAPLVLFSAIAIAILAAKGISFTLFMWAIIATTLYGLILMQLFQRFTLAQITNVTTRRLSALEEQEQERQRQEIIRMRDEIRDTNA